MTAELDDLIATVELFAQMDADERTLVLSRCRRVRVDAGRWCFREGDVADALYLVVNGRLRVFVGDEAREELSRGHIFGEIALLTPARRTAGVLAVRDSELLAVPEGEFRRLVEDRPSLLRRVTEIVIARLVAKDRGAQVTERVLSVGVIGISPNSPVEAVTAELGAALSGHGPTAVVRRADAAQGEARAGWADQLENSHRYVIYQADHDAETAWSNWCVRQADRVLLVANVSSPPTELSPPLKAVLAPPSRTETTSLLLVHPRGSTARAKTAGWLEQTAVAYYYHLRIGSSADIDRVARLVSGRGCGLVLGGGGPRGFAHLGVMRALEEAGIPADAVGGTSIGAVMGALRAMDLDHESRRDLAIAGFVDSGRLFPPTLPLLSMSSARKIRRLLEEKRFFGHLAIEDCWLPFFCVSANLTRADVMIHERGELATAVRASLSIPGILPPVRHGDDLLVDGGVINNLPVDVMRARRDIGTVVAVDLGVIIEMGAPAAYEETPSGWRLLRQRLAGPRTSPRPPGAMSVVMRAKELGAMRAQRDMAATHIPDLLVRPPVDGFGMFDFKAAQRLVDVGYRFALEQLETTGWDRHNC